MSLSTFKSPAVWLFYTALFCLAIGLMQMFSREVTLDSVRNIDFKLIQDFTAQYDLEQTQDKQRFKVAIENLSGPEGKAFYPIAAIGTAFCIENSAASYLCRIFPDASAVEAAIASGKTTEISGTTILNTADNQHYYVGELVGQSRWLIGEAGKYLAFPVDSKMRELAFLKNAHYYLLDDRGRKKLWQKNRWIWLLSFILSISAWVVVSLRRRAQDKKVNKLYQKEVAVESIISEKNNELTVLKLRIGTLETEIEAESSQDEKNIIQQDLKKVQNELLELEKEHYGLIDEKEGLESQLTSARRRLSSESKVKNMEALSGDLNTLKDLWQTDFKWTERYEVESEVATNNKDRTPFTVYVAFSAFERHLKNSCHRYSIYGQDNESRVDKLLEANKIRPAEGKFLHRVRHARNKFLHEGKPPDAKLFSELLILLEEKGTNAKV